MLLAKADAREVRDDDGVPPYLKDNSFGDKETKAQSKKYKFPHDYPNDYVPQQYLPDAIKDKVYYTPGQNGFEKTVHEIRKTKGIE
jgi:putative ATPase